MAGPPAARKPGRPVWPCPARKPRRAGGERSSSASRLDLLRLGLGFLRNHGYRLQSWLQPWLQSWLDSWLRPRLGLRYCRLALDPLAEDFALLVRERQARAVAQAD